MPTVARIQGGQSALRSSWASASISGIAHPILEEEVVEKEYCLQDPAAAEVVENFRSLLNLCSAPEYNFDAFKAAFEKVFDKDMTALSFPMATSISNMKDLERRTTLSYDDFFEQWSSFYANNFRGSPVEIVSVHSLFKGLIEYTILLDFMRCRVAVRSHALIRNGKIIYVERLETTREVKSAAVRKDFRQGAKLEAPKGEETTSDPEQA